MIALWPVALAEALEMALRGGTRRIGDWMAQFGVAEAVFDADDGDPFFNVNSPADLAAAEALIAGMRDNPNLRQSVVPTPRVASE